MSTKDCNADKSRETADAQTTDDDDCCLGEFPCYEHYEADGGTNDESSQELSRIDPIDDGDVDGDDGPRRDWSNATMVRGPSGMARIDFSA